MLKYNRIAGLANKPKIDMEDRIIKPLVVGGNPNRWGVAATLVAIGLVLISLFSACTNPDISPTSG